MPYLTIEIDREAYHLLLEHAANSGTKMTVAASELLMEALQNANADEVKVRLYRAVSYARMRSQQLLNLQQIAISLPHSSAEQHQEFERLCDELGFSMQEILQSVAGLDTQVNVEDNGRQLLSAIIDLRRLIERYSGEIPAAVAERELLAAGYPKAIINAAKNELQLQSVRVARGWVWRVTPREVSYAAVSE